MSKQFDADCQVCNKRGTVKEVKPHTSILIKVGKKDECLENISGSECRSCGQFFPDLKTLNAIRELRKPKPRKKKVTSINQDQ